METKAEKVIVYKPGPLSCSVCVQKDLTREEIVEEVNRLNPTGISTGWFISKDTHFKGGEPMPCVCEKDPNRMHYFLEC